MIRGRAGRRSSEHLIHGNGLKIRNRFSFSMDPALAQQVQSYMETEGLSLDTEAEAVRQLLRIHFASTPELGYLQLKHARAYNEARNWALKKIMNAMMEIAEHMRLTLPAMEAEALNGQGSQL